MSPEKPALIIIDMQRGMSGESAGRRNNPDAEQNIASLLDAWRAATDYNGLLRTAEEVHAMALANLDGEYATIAKAAELRNAI